MTQLTISEARKALLDLPEKLARTPERAVTEQRLGGAPPGDVARILRERAQALARPAAHAEAPADALDLLVFSLSGERYAIELGSALQVVPLRGVTPVPCTPTFVLGVINHRGRILAVLDLRRLWNLPGASTPSGRIVVVEAGDTTLGIFAEAIEGTVPVEAGQLTAPPVALAGGQPVFIRGVTADMVAVLDLGALARDPRITVCDEAGWRGKP